MSISIIYTEAPHKNEEVPLKNEEAPLKNEEAPLKNEEASLKNEEVHAVNTTSVSCLLYGGKKVLGQFADQGPFPRQSFSIQYLLQRDSCPIFSLTAYLFCSFFSSCSLPL